MNLKDTCCTSKALLWKQIKGRGKNSLAPFILLLK